LKEGIQFLANNQSNKRKRGTKPATKGIDVDDILEETQA
jgi:hypothetical protein